MAWIKREKTNNITQIVQKRTGQSAKELLKDTKEYKYNNLEESAELYLYHVKKGSKIGWYCDYDTDGINSDNIQRLIARALRITDFYGIVPRRFSDGYGVKERHIEAFKDCGLLILCDNGIAAIEAVEKAKSYGMDVIVLDHHQPKVDKNQNVILPMADVIVDPHVTGGDFTDLCGAGISYRFAEAVLKKCNWMSEKQKWFFLARASCFAALGTVGDAVSLTHDNRKIVKEGLYNLNKGYATTGLKALCEQANIRNATSTDFAYFLSPIINASGRMNDDGSSFISKLISYDMKNDEVGEHILSDCNKAIETNTLRKKVEAKAVADAFDKIDSTELKEHNFIIIVDENITAGIAGLISGKITEAYHRPSIVLTPTANPNLIKGSGRSVEGVNLKEILDKNNSLIEAYGGHEQACGITLKRENLELFSQKVNEITPQFKMSDDIYYDVECTLDDAYKMYEEIKKYEPYGQGNPNIRVCIKDVEVDKRNVYFMGDEKQHLKIKNEKVEFVWFSHAKDYIFLGQPEKINVIGSLGINSFNGIDTLQMAVSEMEESR